MFVAFVGSTYTRIYTPTNVYKAYVKLYKSYPELAANEISSQWTTQILATHKLWPPRIKMIHSRYFSVLTYKTLDQKLQQLLSIQRQTHL